MTNENNYNNFINKIHKNSKNNLQCNTGIFELTRLCNFKCKMCMFKLNKESTRLSSSHFISIAEELCKYGLIDLTLTGGEVFTRKDFFEIYNNIYDMGIILSIMTNAYLLDDIKISCLSNRPPRIMYISLYGTSDNTYERICGCKLGFTTVFNNIIKLIDAKINIILQATITKLNYCDYSEILAIGKQLEIPVRTSYRIHDPVRNSDTNCDFVNNIRLDINNISPNFDNIVPKIRESNNPSLKKCNASKNSFCITRDGKMQICQNAEYPYVDITNNNIKEALIQLREKVNLITCPIKCKNCEYIKYCDICIGGIHKNKDNIFIPYDDYCKFAKQIKKIINKRR